MLVQQTSSPSAFSRDQANESHTNEGAQGFQKAALMARWHDDLSSFGVKASVKIDTKHRCVPADTRIDQTTKVNSENMRRQPIHNPEYLIQ